MHGGNFVYLDCPSFSKSRISDNNPLIGEDGIAYGVDANSTKFSGFIPKDVLDIIQAGSNTLEIEIADIFRYAGESKGREVTKENSTHYGLEAKNTNTDPITSQTSFLSCWNLWRELMKEVTESPKETKGTLMVVAVVIATKTNEAILSPPSGLWSPDPSSYTNESTVNSFQRRNVLPGEAEMSTNPEVFAIFSVFNAIGFFASTAMISIPNSRFPLRAGARLVILSFAASYMIAATYRASTRAKTARGGCMCSTGCSWGVCKVYFVVAQELGNSSFTVLEIKNSADGSHGSSRV